MMIECRIYWGSEDFSIYTNWLNEHEIIYEKKLDWWLCCDVFKMDEIDATAFKLKFGS